MQTEAERERLIGKDKRTCKGEGNGKGNTLWTACLNEWRRETFLRRGRKTTEAIEQCEHNEQIDSKSIRGSVIDWMNMDEERLL